MCEGELVNLQENIVSIDENKIMVIPKHEEVTEALKFQNYRNILSKITLR